MYKRQDELDQLEADIQTREYRAPEAIVGASPYSGAADVWSAGCIVFEILTGELLFEVASPAPGEPHSKDEAHLAQISEILGALPGGLVARGRRAARGRWYDDAAEPPCLRRVEAAPRDGAAPGSAQLEELLVGAFGLDADDGADAAAFLVTVLAIDPAARLAAPAALEHAWLADLPEDDDDPENMEF